MVPYNSNVLWAETHTQMCRHAILSTFLYHFCISPSSRHMSAFGRYICVFFILFQTEKKTFVGSDAILTTSCIAHLYLPEAPASKWSPPPFKANLKESERLSSSDSGRNTATWGQRLGHGRHGHRTSNHPFAVKCDTTASYGLKREHQGIFPEYTSGFWINPCNWIIDRLIFDLRAQGPVGIIRFSWSFNFQWQIPRTVHNCTSSSETLKLKLCQLRNYTNVGHQALMFKLQCKLTAPIALSIPTGECLEVLYWPF